MKVLIVCNIDSHQNPYVLTLYNAFVKKGIDVTCSIDEFWTNATSYNIVHIQWPNLLLDKSDETCNKLCNVIESIKRKHIPLVCTCHNIIPHYDSGISLNNAYKVVYNNCDYIHHLGEASISLLKEQYPGMRAEHFVVPHHTYDELYNLNISKKEARKRLGIPQDIKCILSVGAFRHDEERKIILNLRKQLKRREFYIIAPGFFRIRIFRKNIIITIKALILALKYNLIAKYYGIRIYSKYLPNDVLSLYLKAADVMLIQRKKILNSGNVSLAMLAALPIVGPNDGNVENILRKTGNFIFDKNNLEDLPNLIKEAVSADNLGQQNFEYAMKNLTTSSVVDSLISFYCSCLSR